MARRQPAEEDLLFDLPLERRPAERATAPDAEPRAAEEEPIEQPPLPLTDEPIVEVTELEGEEATVTLPAEEEVDATPARRRRWVRHETPRATLRPRLVAGLTDVGVCAGVLVVLLVALLAQGIRPGLADWPAGAVFLLSFSFLYSVLPLAFWGRTPGMTLAALRATGRDGGPLTFRQAALRWLASVLTVALAGVPLLLAVGGRRSLSDLISGSRTERSEMAG